MLRTICTLALTGSLAIIGTTHGAVMEPLREIPSGWHQVGTPAASDSLQFRIAMTHPNEALFEQTQIAISTPDHSRYGQHLKRDELKELLRPIPSASKAVTTWLEDSGITTFEDDGEWINFGATVEKAEQLLNTTFSIYVNEQPHTGMSRNIISPSYRREGQGSVPVFDLSRKHLGYLGYRRQLTSSQSGSAPCVTPYRTACTTTLT